MALHDEVDIIAPAHKAIPGVQIVHRGWPDCWGKLPCISINEASNLPAYRADNRERITELEYYVRVWGKTHGDIKPIASMVDDVMTGMYYERTMTYDDDSADVKQKIMRYRKYL